MNNEEKNTYVKKQITDALLTLLKEKPLENISVTEITKKAGVGRVSFYRNYESKEDILRAESDRLIIAWGRFFEQSPDASPQTLFPSLFDFCLKNRRFYRILYKAGQSNVLLDTILRTVSLSEHATPAEIYMKQFWAYGIFGWLNAWIGRGMKESGAELLSLFKQTA
ncbi:MAG: TetR/AcrR family transcriptional regulator [Lachnospiraceae bacterium]|nr:TetR/AcrR family transcriptional regulator [Lachnospiraceae bacterium]